MHSPTGDEIKYFVLVLNHEGSWIFGEVHYNVDTLGEYVNTMHHDEYRVIMTIGGNVNVMEPGFGK